VTNVFRETLRLREKIRRKSMAKKNVVKKTKRPKIKPCPVGTDSKKADRLHDLVRRLSNLLLFAEEKRKECP